MSKFSRLTITVPQVLKSFQSYSTPATKKANIEMIREINSDYGSMCQKWGNVFEIEKGVLIAFIATESGGKSNLVSFVGCCYGLMQVSPEAILECANKFDEITGVQLPEEVRASIARTPNVIGKTKLSSSAKSALIKRLYDPNFNIMCGTMILRWLLERFSTFLTGAQLNKAIVGYNAGAYTRALNPSGRPNKIPVDTARLVTMSTVPRESRNYLVKMLGVDGFLQLIYKDKAI